MQENTLGLNVSFPIYNANGTSFNDLVIHKATLESIVMSFGDKLTGDVYYKDNSLADVTDAYVYVEGVKYVLVSPPTIVREGLVSDNSELNGMTKYSFTFYHPMYIVGNFPFTDIAVTQDEERYLSQNKTFSWIGNLNDFIAKLNANLRDTEWLVTSAYASEEEAAKAATLSEVLTFDKNFVTDACKTAYEQWEIPFSVISINQTVGGVQKNFAIKFGTPTQEILDSNNNPYIFQMGQGVGLKNNSRTPRNNKIVTRIVGYGSEKNIPYGYPQIQWHGTSGAQFTYGDHAGTYQNVVIEGHTFAKVVSYPIYKGILGGQYVELIKHPFTRTTLMPTVYSEDVFNKVSPYLSDGTVNPNYDPDTVIRDYYDADAMDYPNPCDENSPCVEIHQFEKIKPELGEEYIEDAKPYDNVAENPLETAIALANFLAQIQYDLTNNVTNQNEVVALNSLYNLLSSDGGERHFADQGGSYTFRCDVTYDTYYYYVKYVSDNINYDVVCLKTGAVVTPVWDDTMDDDGNYVQSYFKMTLPQLGFDMYACASITENMQINMRSGACMGCTFDVQVDWEDYKRNFYNADGEFDPVPHTTEGDGHVRDLTKYPDTSAGSVTFILQKDLQTFGTIMPNMYQQPRGGEPDPYYPGDKFVILGISLPQSYVDTAQIHLDDAMKEYMLENNAHYFDYPLKFDEFFLAQNTNILSQITLNSIVRFRFPTQQLPIALFVKAITIKYGQKELPEYDITLTDDIEIVLNQIGQVTDDVSRLRVQMSEIQKFYSQDMFALLQEKLSKVEDDIAQGRITFQQGLMSLASTIFGDEIRSNNYKSGTVGGRGWRIDNLGNAEMESLRVRSFLEVTELLINRIQAQEGDTMFTDNDQIDKVEVYNIGGTDIYTLSLKEKYDGYVTSQVKGNILRGVVFVTPAHNAGLTEYTYDDAQESEFGHNFYITSWMQVRGSYGDDPMRTTYPQLAVLKKNQIRVVLYGDGDVPADVNFAPCELMTVVRWGCYQNPLEAATEYERQNIIRRQNVFYISTKDGRLSKLRGVSSPKLSNGNYGTTLGTIPDFVREWSIASRLIEGRDYLYAQGIIVGDFIKVDAEGTPIVNFVDCGDWVDGSLVQNPTNGHGVYLFNEYNEDSLQYETHDVWHNGAKWRCLMHQPHNNVYYEPTEANSAYWEKLLDSGESAVEYEIRWETATGSANNIPCTSTGIAKTIVGEINDPWLTVKLYRRVGNGTAALFNANKVILRAYLANGNPVESQAVGNTWPKQSIDISYITLTNNEAYERQNVKYVAEFYGQNNVLLGTSSIARILDGQNGSDGDDGFFPPQYTDEWYAWNSDPNTPPSDSAFSDTIPPRGNNAYLWKRIQLHLLDTSTTPYSYTDEDYQYFRMTGDSGTSIRVEGTANAVIDLIDSTLPAAEEGQLGVLEDSRALYEYNNGSWVDTGEMLPVEGYVIIKDSTDFIYWDNAMSIWEWTSGYPVVVDGTSYTEQRDGHLWMYSTEALAWIDLGQFKGENGKTYYTHIAWATNVDTTTTPITVTGFVTSKSASDTTHLWMGVLIDENQGQDPTNASLYTWSYTKGTKGDNGARGKVGRWFYYGGLFDSNNSTKEFVVNDAATPYFLHYDPVTLQKMYHVFNPETNPNNDKATMSEMWNTYTPSPQSFNVAPWEAMTNDFDYLITKAIFGEFAQFGSAVINGDWMISTNGTINGTEYQNGSEYRGAASYKWFDPVYPNVDHEYSEIHEGQTVTWHNFIPYYCVDLRTGEVYMQKAHIKGEIDATSGTFRGSIYAIHGNIGGFTIGTNTLSNTSAQNGQGVSIIGSNHKAFIGISQSRDSDTLNGANIASEFACNEPREAGATNPVINVAVRATANGNGTDIDNFAFYGVGKVVTNNSFFQYGLDDYTLNNSAEYLNLKAGNVMLIKGANKYAFLPKISNVRNALKIPTTTPFAVELTLLVGDNGMRIVGRLTQNPPQDNEELPYLRDNNFEHKQYFEVHRGQVFKFMLVYDGSRYDAWLLQYGDRDL